MKTRIFHPKALAVLAGVTLACAGAQAQLAVTSTAFVSNGAIPDPFTYSLGAQCSGANQTPALTIANIPAGTQTLAIRVIDTSAGNFLHWKAWAIPAPGATVTLTQNSGPAAGGVTKNNDFGANGYGGPCPPTGTGTHNYEFRVYALPAAAGGPEPTDAALDALPAASRGMLVGTRTFGVSVPIPGGAGAGAQAIPTMSELGLALTGMVLAGAAAARMRRRKL